MVFALLRGYFSPMRSSWPSVRVVGGIFVYLLYIVKKNHVFIAVFKALVRSFAPRLLLEGVSY